MKSWIWKHREDKKHIVWLILLFVCLSANGCASKASTKSSVAMLYPDYSFMDVKLYPNYPFSDSVKQPTTYLGEYNSHEKYNSYLFHWNIKKTRPSPPLPFKLLRTEYGLNWLSKKLEKNTRPFSTSYFTDGKKRHTAVFFDIRGGALIYSGTATRPGSIPYSVPGSGDMYAIYRDINRKEVGRHSIYDPSTVRICDFSGEGEIGIRHIQEGKVEVRIPFNPDIKYLELSEINGSSILYSLGN